jgi:hypothetical protein
MLAGLRTWLPILEGCNEGLAIPASASRSILEEHKPRLFRVQLRSRVTLEKQWCLAFDALASAIVSVNGFVTATWAAVDTSHFTHSL